MISFIYNIPDIYFFIVLSILSILVSIGIITVIRKKIPSEILYRDNPVLGSIGSLVGIIYGVLAGLTALYLINNINYTADAVLKEASAVANVYRDSTWLPKSMRVHIQEDIKRYLQQVIYVEWPLMQENAVINGKGNSIIDHIGGVLVRDSKIASPGEMLVLRDLLEELKLLYDAREQRIHMSFAALNTSVWMVILIGTILTLGINYLFGMNFYLHIFAVSVAALMASSIIFLLVTLDRPFQGEFAIQPDAFKVLLSTIQTQLAEPQKAASVIQ
jgi:hypothetical protein